MCGIVGILAKSEFGKNNLSKISDAVLKLNKRGPDNQSHVNFNNVALGHARLSIIDTSSGAHQPFSDSSNRYHITFNGEIYNYKLIKEELISKGYSFRTESDTEVLLYSFIEYGEKCLDKLNGFFAFAVYDSLTEELFIARDRMGIKPLHIYEDEDKIIWASELKAIFEFDIDKSINNLALTSYFKLNYIPKDLSILSKGRKLSPGAYMTIKKGVSESNKYFNLKVDSNNYSNLSYSQAKSKLDDELRKSVDSRLVADVPLGAFLSGGIDSSIISGIASELKPNLNTFSIGYADEPMFDETHYAELVANKFKTNHHVFKLKNDDLFHSLTSFEDYLDEPFADSSALAVNILAEETKKLVTVSLSGDGADELFSGYNKHKAEYLIRNKSLTNQVLKFSPNIWSLLPQSRNSSLVNLFRQLDKFSKGLKLSKKDRYWSWLGISSEKEVEKLLLSSSDMSGLKEDVCKHIGSTGDFNEYLLSDLEVVLTGEMLTKVDLMSMNNSLEIRVPFLDHNLVNFANTLPAHYKIDKDSKKKILQDTYKDFLPSELYHRPKHGFEVPLLKWFKGPLKSKIEELLLEESFIKEQQIFNFNVLRELVNKLNSNSPGDSAAKIWAILVFQMWWKKYY